MVTAPNIDMYDLRAHCDTIRKILFAMVVLGRCHGTVCQGLAIVQRHVLLS